MTDPMVVKPKPHAPEPPAPAHKKAPEPAEAAPPSPPLSPNQKIAQAQTVPPEPLPANVAGPPADTKPVAPEDDE